MNIALFYAMPKEIESLLTQEQINKPYLTDAGVNFYVLDSEIFAVAGGVGKVNAAMAAQLAISRFALDCIINVGVAGCFKNVEIGTLILADKFIQHDVDTTGCGDPIGLVSTVNTVEFPTSYPEFTKKAMDMIGVPYLVGTGATGDWFAKRSDPNPIVHALCPSRYDMPYQGDRAKWIQDTFNPLFIEMEGAAIAQVCMRNKVGFVALKSVSDCLFGDDNYDFNFPKAMENLNKIALQLARNMHKLL